MADQRSSKCEVQFTKKGYTVICNQDYNPGEQIFVSYGSHSNDVLLADCE
jgi:hypothetical protein